MQVNRKLILISLIVIVAVGVVIFSRSESPSVLYDTDGFRRDQDAQVEKNNKDILSRTDTIGSQSGVKENTDTISPISIPALRNKEYNGREFTLGKVLLQDAEYTRYYITYLSGDLKISGIMNVPKGASPAGGFPVLILNHGYIDPAVYTNGRGLRREQDYLAKQGFVVIHPDYRNHADSSKDSDADVNLRTGYVEDVINAVYAVKNADLPYVNKDKIGMLGHSMGGGISQTVAVTKPDLVDAFVLYAPVSMDVRDSFNRWMRDRREVADAIVEAFGEPDQNKVFWDNISPITFVNDIKSPVLFFHGTSDADVPIEWTHRSIAALKAAGKQAELIEYPGQPHEFTSAHPDFMKRTAQFFYSHLQ